MSTRALLLFGILFLTCVSVLQAEAILMPTNEIKIDKGQSAHGFDRYSYKKSVLPPPVDQAVIFQSGDCSDFVDLSGEPLPIVVTGSTVGYSGDYGPFPVWPGCWDLSWHPGSGSGSDVTFKWTAPADGRYTISLDGSSYDTVLLLYRFTCPEEPVYPDDYICGNDDYAIWGGSSELTAFPLNEGEELLIVVDGYGSHAGDYRLTIREYEPVSDLDSFITQTMEQFHIPGLSACVVRNGETIWTGSYGYANIEEDLEVGDTTIFTLASISKTVTSVALMQLYDQGLFELDDDINDYLPFEVSNPNFPDSPITFRMLLSHVSSIHDRGYGSPTDPYWGGDSPIPLGEALEEYLTPEGIYYSPQNYKTWAPGEGYEYSNVGFGLLGHLVETITDTSTSFPEYCQDSIFAPLEMDETSWFYADLDTNNVARPYHWTGLGDNYSRYSFYGYAFYPAGTLKSSTLHLARFLTAFMQHGQYEGMRILDSTTVDLMTVNYYPGLCGMQGLCWYPDFHGGRWIWGHTGGWYGVNNRMFYCPDENTGVIMLSNGFWMDIQEGDALIQRELFEMAGVGIEVPTEGSSPLPQSYELFQNYPNPFNPTTTITFDVPETTGAVKQVQLTIYNIRGKQVIRLVDTEYEPGTHRVIWNGRNEQGQQVSSGIYLYTLRSGEQQFTKKMVILK